jgi:CHAD domain-containing protein
MAVDQQALEAPFRKLRKRLKKFPQEPLPDVVHKLRTRTRRVEAALETLAPNSRCDQRLLKGLKRVRKRAGKVRDMDVLTAYLRDLNVSDSENDCIVLLTEHLGGTRSRQAVKLRKDIRKTSSKLRRDLRTCASEITRAVSNTGNRNSGQGPDPVTEAMSEAMRASAELAAPRLGRGNLHEYRLTIKKLLNVLRMAREEQQDQKLVEELNRVKDSIGEWHDWQVLEQIAEQVIQHNRCKLQARLRATVRERYQKALSITNAVKARYFNEPRVTVRPSPVLKAMIGIAA